MEYVDYQIQELFEGLCEQILDTLGIEDGRKFLKKNFVGFEDAIEIKIAEYQKGNRITKKLDKPDEAIKRICQ